MQNVNNNMDEMFRKAAAGYPLKTDNSDWDGLASRLLILADPSNTDQKKSRFNKYGLPLLLVFLMLTLGDGTVKQTGNRITAYPPSHTENKTNIHKDADLSNLRTITDNQDHSQKLLNNESAVLQVADHEPANGSLLPGNTTAVSNYSQTTNSAVDKISGKNVRAIDAPELTYNTAQLVKAGKMTAAGSDLSINKMITDTQPVVGKKVNAIQRPSKFYWGIVFGPGINQVKKQRVQKTGFDIGIMAGVSILKGKAAVETGLLYTQKYYFSDGKYFNMDKTGGSMPQGMEIMSLEGSSRLVELPVKFKYSVLQKNKTSVFLSTGISSYLMTREENDYLAMMNGSEQNMLGMYKNTRRYIAVAANIGAEFNYKIGTRTRLGIEPYFQIPFKGIGVGSMPVMTTGIHFSFMRFTP
jgi:hypothetical protein